MKVRVYYDGYEDEYLPQYMKWGTWWTFKWDKFVDCVGVVKIEMKCPTKEDAIEWIEWVKQRNKVAREKELAAREREKKSGVVYEGEI
jgi:hypothetical protein